MNPYLYVIVLLPTKKAHEDGETARMIGSLGVVLAPDEAGARLRAAREIPDELQDKIDRVRVRLMAFP